MKRKKRPADAPAFLLAQANHEIAALRDAVDTKNRIIHELTGRIAALQAEVEYLRRSQVSRVSFTNRIVEKGG